MKLEKPLLLFDGDCGFCRRWIERWKVQTRGRVDYAPFQERAAEFDPAELERLGNAVHLFESDGRVSRGAEAVFRTLGHAPCRGWLLWTYRRIPGAAPLSELGYRLVARHRIAADAITKLLWGPDLRPSTFLLASSLFLRLLGLVFLIAFVSLWVQVDGLFGSGGLLPATDFLNLVGQQIGGARFWRLPTLCWINSSDGFFHGLCGAGTVLSLGLIAGVAPGPLLLLLWLLYLSLVAVGQEFLSFQWDVLLLETAFMALFIAPWRWRTDRDPTALDLGLQRWLLFKLMFLSGITKLLSGDPTWRNLTALPLHYETQPLPTWVGWYAYHLPSWFHHGSLIAMFAAELAAPFLIFAPRRLRHAASAAMILFQALIGLTGNYNFFNLLTMLLCFLLLDDRFLSRWIPSRWRAATVTSAASTPTSGRLSRFRVPLALALLLVSVLAFLEEMVRTDQGAIGNAGASVPAPAHWFLNASDRYLLSWAEPLFLRPIRPFATINGYGLFRVMTTERPEIVIEGSANGKQWKEYQFRWKPGALDHRPRFVEPHQPRLDWQMWFAALSPQGQRRWLLNLCMRLLEGSPDVLALVGENPFPKTPPRYIRLAYYQYHFTDLEAHRRTGAWWRRELRGYLTQPIALPTSGPGA